MVKVARRSELTANRSEHRLVARELVGREHELGSLDAAFAAAAAGNERVVLVAGDAGIGKTALVRAFLARARFDGARVFVGECTEAEAARPFGPFVDVLRAAMAELPGDTERTLRGDASELRRFLPGREGGQLVPPSSATERYRTHESFAALFAELARPVPLVIAVEDLHWADPATLELVPYLARKLSSGRVLVVTTYRSDELHRLHPLAPVLAELRRLPQAIDVHVRPLSLMETGKLVQVALGQKLPPTSEFCRALDRVCEGNPFFLEEVLKTLAQRGDLVYRAGAWEPDKEVPNLVIPDSIRGAVEQRVYALSGDAQRALRVAAVIGRRFDFDLLQQVSELPERTLLDALTNALDAQLIVEDSDPGGDRLVFRHALTRETVLAGLLQRERRSLHRFAAEALEGRAGDNPTTVADALAYHFDEAGERERALRYHVLAADEAARVFGFMDAVRHLERACALASADQRTMASLHAQLAQAADLAQEPRRALHAAETAQALYQALGDAAGVSAALTRMATCHNMLGDLRAGTRLAAAAVAAAEPLGPSAALAEASLIAEIMADGNGDTLAVIANGEQAIAAARASASYSVLATATAEVGLALIERGRAAEGLTRIREGLAIALERGLVPAADAAYNLLAVSLRDLGAPRAERRAAYDEGLRYSRHHGYWHDKTRQREIDLAWFDGDWDRLLRFVTELHDTIYSAEPALLAAFAGAAREGPRDFLAPAREARRRLLASGARWRVALTAGSAALHWLADDARATLDDAAIFAELVDSSEHPLGPWSAQENIGPIAMFALLAAERLGDAAAVTRWTELMTRDPSGPEPWALAGARSFAQARRAARGGDLDGALALLAETARALEEGDMPFGLTVARLERAGLLLRRGRPGDREAAAAELAAALPYWRTAKATWYLGKLRRWARARRLPFPEPAAPSVAPRRGGRASVLSRREREVAELVAQGLTNAQIAQRLTITERTAEGHVEHIRNKLGFHSRVQIGAWVAGALASTPERARSS